MATRPALSGQPEADSPLAGLELALAGLELDGSLLGLAPEFENLRGRLPAELLAAEDPFHLDEEGMAALRDEVRELLMARLQEGRHAD